MAGALKRKCAARRANRVQVIQASAGHMLVTNAPLSCSLVSPAGAQESPSISSKVGHMRVRLVLLLRSCVLLLLLLSLNVRGCQSMNTPADPPPRTCARNLITALPPAHDRVRSAPGGCVLLEALRCCRSAGSPPVVRPAQCQPCMHVASTKHAWKEPHTSNECVARPRIDARRHCQRGAPSHAHVCMPSGPWHIPDFCRSLLPSATLPWFPRPQYWLPKAYAAATNKQA